MYYLGPDLDAQPMTILFIGTGGMDDGFERAARELGCAVCKSSTGSIIGLESNQPFTQEQIQLVNQIIREEMDAYVESK